MFIFVYQISLRKQFMKVRQNIIDKIDNPEIRVKIATILKCGEQAVAHQLRFNKHNGRMTKLDYLMAISEVTGIAVGEIVEESSINSDMMLQR